MRNLFSIGTDQFISALLQKGDVQGKFLELVEKYPKINMDKLTIKNTDPDIEPNQYNALNVNVLREKSIDELLHIAIDSCEPYLLPANSRCVFRNYGIEDGTAEDELSKVDNEVFFRIDVKEDAICFRSEEIFKKSVKMYLLLSSIYSYSLIESNALKSNVQRLMKLGFTKSEASQLGKELSKLVYTATSRTNYGDSVKHRNFATGQANQRFYYYKLNWLFNKKLFDEFLSTGKQRRGSCWDEEKKTAEHIQLESYYDYLICQGISQILLDKDGCIKNKINTGRKTDVLQDIVSYFSFKNSDLNKYIESSEAFRLITEYAIEHLTNINLVYFYASCFLLEKQNRKSDMAKNYHFRELALLDGSLNSLIFYPLLRLRLDILYWLPEVVEKDDKNFEEIMSLLKHQTIHYFPVLSCLFHILLKIKWPKNNFNKTKGFESEEAESGANVSEGNNQNILKAELASLYMNFAHYLVNAQPMRLMTQDEIDQTKPKYMQEEEASSDKQPKEEKYDFKNKVEPERDLRENVIIMLDRENIGSGEKTYLFEFKNRFSPLYIPSIKMENKPSYRLSANTLKTYVILLNKLKEEFFNDSDENVTRSKIYNFRHTLEAMKFWTEELRKEELDIKKLINLEMKEFLAKQKRRCDELKSFNERLNSLMELLKIDEDNDFLVQERFPLEKGHEFTEDFLSKSEDIQKMMKAVTEKYYIYKALEDFSKNIQDEVTKLKEALPANEVIVHMAVFMLNHMLTKVTLDYYEKMYDKDIIKNAVKM